GWNWSWVLVRAELPKHLRAKQLATGGIAYYYEVPTRWRHAGCPIISQPLGYGLGPAIAKAEELNTAFDGWRRGDEISGPRPGTVAWLRRRYEKSAEFDKLKPRTQRFYSQKLDIIETGWGNAPALGDYSIDAISKKIARGYYRKLQEPKSGGEPPRLQQANHVIRIARVLWQFAVNEDLISDNPFKGWRLDGVEVEDVVWNRTQVETLVAMADKLGYPAVGTAALLAFELCQREGDVLRLTWSQFDGEAIQIRQGKTGSLVWIPLVPDLTHLKERLDTTLQRGPLIVMQDRADKRRTVFLPYKESTFAKHFQKIRSSSGLPSKLKFMHLRHSGATELGDAGATDAEIMSLTGHRTRAMVSKYTKRTRDQARSATAKRSALRARKARESE
ncbi:MAG: tyrosine-type recombinase/integrase, partial [Proteobacteria bacterium]|nr:tyrosine-type recombinase/integrase [Pseudomonadota bacterium]